MEGRSGCIHIAHHVARHAQMELNLRVIRKFLCAFLKQSPGLLVVALFVEDPPESVCYSGVCRLQGPGFLRKIVGLVGLVQALGVQVSEIIQGVGRVWFHRQKLS